MERLVVVTIDREIYQGASKEEILDKDEELREFLENHPEISEDEVWSTSIQKL